MHDRHAPEFEQIDIFMFLIHPFGRHLQRVFVSKHILPLALGMRLWRPKQPDEIRVGNSLPEATWIGKDLSSDRGDLVLPRHPDTRGEDGVAVGRDGEVISRPNALAAPSGRGEGEGLLVGRLVG
jgi:hypothetical protein